MTETAAEQNADALIGGGATGERHTYEKGGFSNTEMMAIAGIALAALIVFTMRDRIRGIPRRYNKVAPIPKTKAEKINLDKDSKIMHLKDLRITDPPDAPKDQAPGKKAPGKKAPGKRAPAKQAARRPPRKQET